MKRLLHRAFLASTDVRIRVDGERPEQHVLLRPGEQLNFDVDGEPAATIVARPGRRIDVTLHSRPRLWAPGDELS